MLLIVSKNKKEIDQIGAILAERDYTRENLSSIEKLESRLKTGDVLATFVDIDTVPVDNRCIRTLTLKHPSVYFFCMSHDKFHPELKDAICYHIYACLTKPVDPDELIYWLRCIDVDEKKSRGPSPDPSKMQTD